MFGMFKRKPDPRPMLTVHLNARLQPVHRGDMFEDPLDRWLRENDLGEVVGGGTAFTPETGVLSCDLEVCVNALDDATLDALAARLAAMGAPTGSKLILDGVEARMVGAAEGLALHLNGTELPDEVYETCGADELIDMLEAALGERGRFMSHHDGAYETSLYLYGPSYDDMAAAIAPVLASYPLCQKARLEKIT